MFFGKTDALFALSGASAVVGVVVGPKARSFPGGAITEAGLGLVALLGGAYIDHDLSAPLIGFGAGVLVDGVLALAGVSY